MEAIKIGSVLVPYRGNKNMSESHHWQLCDLDISVAAFFDPLRADTWTVAFDSRPKKGSRMRIDIRVYGPTLTACLAELLEECDLRGLAIEIDAIGVDAKAIADAVWTEDVVRAVDAAERVVAA